MKRVLKFRAWNKTTKEMLTPADLEYHGIVIFPKGNIRQLHQGKDFIGTTNFEDELVLLQFTGLKDKNGKEIYEGDIVNNEDYPFQDDGVQGYYGIIEWFEEDLCWSVSVICVNKNLNGVAVGCGLNEHKNWEIIGNVWENPNLPQ